MFVSLLSKFFICHESGAALETAYFLVIFSVIKESMLEVDGISVEAFSRKGSSCSSFLNCREIHLVGGEVVSEFGHKWLIKTLFSHIKPRILFLG